MTGCTSGDFDRYVYRNGEASTALCVVQEVRSSALLARNGSFAVRHFHHKRHSFSRGEDFRVCRNFPGSKYFFNGAEHASHKTSSSLVCRMQNSQGSDWEREEARWLREEKRWVREEERWLREEARWAAERKDLLEQTALYREQIKALKLEIAQLDSQVMEEKSKDGTMSELIMGLTRLLQSLNMECQASSFQGQISSSSSSSTDIRTALGSMPLEIPVKTIEMVTAVSQPSILGIEAAPAAPSPSRDRSRTIKRGAEGDDVKVLQEALAKLGFYSGDDDMEYSTFSSGTERAVRSWQAALGALEDGIMTAELLKKLLSEETAIPITKESPSSSSQGKAAPSAKVAAPTSSPGVKTPDTKGKTTDVKPKTTGSPGTKSATAKAASSSLKKPSSSVVETSRPRVYLLGENRWEEPDRLFSKNGPIVATATATASSKKCFSCKGPGTMMCTECEGTGELNVEEQFLEWAEEGAKCPYCEGKEDGEACSFPVTSCLISSGTITVTYRIYSQLRMWWYSSPSKV
ncbi:hypothetical protein GOP47_0013408 [Adiantum capillus-veneris]|uniref:Peptidoglycan binding-like domain-containing protein n=1 Tax=Adiantum capillus-veneris TaxID=13818 RepID=A0A9D4UPE8_ADICA|nr:hypothetical protein GOP47_0013408 [Adiantum capillus-veneris]